MKYNPEIHHRRSIRLKGYDYTQPGAYFVTMVTHHRDEIFGKIINGEMILSPLGKIVQEEWFRSGEIRKEIQLFDDEFVVMPNHVHGINWIIPVGADGVRPGVMGAYHAPQPMRPDETDVPPHNGRMPSAPTHASLRRAPRSLGSFIAGFKASVTSRAGRELNMTGIWQRNYYEHIIRNDRELHNIGWYIQNNPLNWQLDRDNERNIRKLSPPEQVDEYVKDVEDMILKLKANDQ